MSSRPKPRVLHLAKFYPPERGGMERVLQQLCDMTSDEVENDVLAAHVSRGTVRERVGAVHVTRAGCWARVGSVAVCPSYPIWLRRARADVTVLHEPNAPALVADVLAPGRWPLVVWYHADLVRPSWIYDTVYRPLLQRVLRRAARIIVSSPNLIQHAQGLRGVRGKCVVVPFGIDATAARRPVPVPQWFRTFQAAAKTSMALMVGRMVPYKGVDVFLRALAYTDVSAIIVGSGPELVRYRAMANDLGLADRVMFAGNVPDDELVSAYQQCDFFVLPSVTRQEAFGVVQLEAMACGRPVISTNLPTGVPWVNRHGETGLVVEPGDVKGLSEAISRMGHDAELRLRLGAAAERRVRHEFTLERMRDRTLSVYDDVIKGVGAVPAVAALRRVTQ